MLPLTIRRCVHLALALPVLLVPAACASGSGGPGTMLASAYVAPRAAIAPLPSEKYAAVVVDGTSGRVLYGQDATELRHPASLTKMMTLYMLFEAMESGRINRATVIPVSAEAASRPPTKLGLKAGEGVDVDTAIKALIVRSANDVATALGEYLGGTEERFASMMTAKARSLGMRQTVFRNASGLPDPQQVTTARDMAALSIALRRKFPQHYFHFRTTEFLYRGRAVRGHNKLIENVYGVDGLKTGYIRASGYNVATSVARNGRRLVVVVMGGKSSAQRDAHVAEIIEAYLPAPGMRPPLATAAAQSAISPTGLPGVDPERAAGLAD